MPRALAQRIADAAGRGVYRGERFRRRRAAHLDAHARVECRCGAAPAPAAHHRGLQHRARRANPLSHAAAHVGTASVTVPNCCCCININCIAIAGPSRSACSDIFGPGGQGNALLVTTSGIKVGADLSADTLITEPAPPDTLLRRAGRCARFPGEEGRVIVAQVTDIHARTSPTRRHPGRACCSAWRMDRRTDAAEELAALDALWEEATPEQMPARAARVAVRRRGGCRARAVARRRR